MEPAVDDGVGRGLGVLPVARHHVLAADDDLAAGAVRDFLALGVQDDDVHRLHQPAGGAEAGVALRVRADDRGGLGETVALEHGHAHGAEEALELDVQQGAAAHEELHPAAEALAHLLEEDLVEQGHEGLAPEGAARAAVVVFLVVLDGVLDGEVEEFLHLRALLLDAGLDVLLEVAGEGRDGQHHVRARLGDGRRDVAQGGEGVLADGHEGDGAGVSHHRVHARHVREAVVQREDDEHRGVRADGDDRVALGHVGRVVAVRQEDALRVRRRAGGVGDVRVVVRADGLEAGLELVAVGLQELVAHLLDLGHPDLLGLQRVIVEGGVVEDDDLLHVRALVQDGADAGQVVPRDEDVLGFGVVDAEDEVLALAEVHGEGDVDGAGVQGADLRQDPHRAALGQEGDLVPLLHAQGDQAGADAVGLVPGLLLGDFRPFSVDFLTEIYVVGELPGVFLDKVDDRGSFCHNQV